ncbi:fatty acyl-CoA reductase 3-like isoform X1 [Chenopodium quinoa]|uniref:fatty acyl-CoA reductase 3-like isoform X1 n=1 Tax=Chenopodium quinoa TaxID=63459 RepID=UPI000B786889|nr:fatty acyl-CoA reductase 3-like isoform X1 [Chenopodium quinoa]
MEVGNGVEFFRNKIILITGATGFLAKVLVEKILRVQPNVKKLYLLIRAKDNKAALERLHSEIIGKDLFRVLRERHGNLFDSFISEKVAPITGDVSSINLGLTNNDSDFCKEVNAIVHSAAITRFEERYDSALGINTFGARNIIGFAKTCPNLQILIDVSTAYVCGKKTGLIPETLYNLDENCCGIRGFDVNTEKKLVDNTLLDLTIKGASSKEIRDTMKQLGLKRAKLYGWPNTYVFTKAMGETLIHEHKGNLPLVIIRPTMISSTYKEPFPGWIEGLGSLANVSILNGKGYINLINGDGNTLFDSIPVDMVANSILTAMVANANKPCLEIYHVCSSLRNPLFLGKELDIHSKYFAKNPWYNGQGTLVKTNKFRLVKSRVQFQMLLVLLIVVSLMLKLVDIASCHFFKAYQDKLEMYIKVTYKVATNFRPYTCKYVIHRLRAYSRTRTPRS